jgi:nucleoside-diphosphate-sugar epimerase
MHILIYGSKGWIGQQFVEILNKNNIKYTNGQSRADNKIDLINEIELIKPTHIISLIGRTHGKIDDKIYPTIDYLEQKGKIKENVRDNLFSPLLLAEISKNRNIHFTYLGTGCIFKYESEDKTDKFTEDSLPNFFGSAYSIVKGYTDQLMHLYNNVLNLRIRMPITDEKNARNFITKITSYEKICSVSNSMSVLPELLPIILDMMQNDVVGTINLTNPGVISHNEILEMYKEIVDPNFKWMNFSEEEQKKILSADRSNNYLDTTKLESLYPKVNNIKDAVRKSLIQYKKNNECMNLLITGGCGFIASNFINHYFMKNEHKINKLINIDAMYYCADEKNVIESIRVNEKYKLIKGNICNSKLISETLEEFNITHIIHFAAQSHVQNSFDDSLQYSNDNIIGTHTLLECCRLYGKIEKFIHISRASRENSKRYESLIHLCI